MEMTNLCTDHETDSQDSSSDNADSDYEYYCENGDVSIDTSFIKNSSSIRIEDCDEDEPLEYN